MTVGATRAHSLCDGVAGRDRGGNGALSLDHHWRLALESARAVLRSGELAREHHLLGDFSAFFLARGRLRVGQPLEADAVPRDTPRRRLQELYHHPPSCRRSRRAVFSFSRRGARAQDHSFARHPRHLSGLEICQDQDAPAFEVGGVGVVDPQAGTNRARPGRLPEVDLLTPEFVRFRVLPGLDDLAHADVEPHHIGRETLESDPALIAALIAALGALLLLGVLLGLLLGVLGSVGVGGGFGSWAVFFGFFQVNPREEPGGLGNGGSRRSGVGRVRRPLGEEV
mmetsp:Transcript_50483/g.114653  ORF Transcript_50483/g.114653 Transcript_50483/m.114653 type:complete len:283 (+) Transcript_50483:166-1014(+)